MVPTVECEPPPSRFWSTITAMLIFSMASASGCGYRGRKVRTKKLKFSYKRRVRFGRERVKHKRRFARPRQAGEDGDLAFWELKRDILQVIFSRSAHLDVLLGHALSLLRSKFWTRIPALLHPNALSGGTIAFQSRVSGAVNRPFAAPTFGAMGR